MKLNSEKYMKECVLICRHILFFFSNTDKKIEKKELKYRKYIIKYFNLLGRKNGNLFRSIFFEKCNL